VYRIAITSLMMRAVHVSGTSVYFNKMHSAISQKAVMFILTTVRTIRDYTVIYPRRMSVIFLP
jgi:hypothetical protein